MLQVPHIKENTEKVIEGLAKRNKLDVRERVSNILTLDEERKKIQAELDAMLGRANQIAREIGDLFKSGRAAEANDLKAETADIKERSKGLEQQLDEKEEGS